MNLREQLLKTFAWALADGVDENDERKIVDAILSIPEILDALALVDDYVPPMTNEQMRAHLDKIFQAQDRRLTHVTHSNLTQS